MDEKTTILDCVLYTLNQLEIHGKKNLSMLLGAIQEAERLKAMLEQEKEASECPLQQN